MFALLPSGGTMRIAIHVATGVKRRLISGDDSRDYAYGTTHTHTQTMFRNAKFNCFELTCSGWQRLKRNWATFR